MEMVLFQVRDLEESKCIAIDHEAEPAELSALNAGTVASYYYIKVNHQFSSSLSLSFSSVLSVLSSSLSLSLNLKATTMALCALHLFYISFFPPRRTLI